MKLKVDEASLLSRDDCADTYINKILPCGATDFAAVLGCFNGCAAWVSWFTRTDDSKGNLIFIASSGHLDFVQASCRDGCIRPVLKVSNLDYVSFENVSMVNGMQEVEYGEYPQDVASSEISKALDEKLAEGQLEKTGKTYTFDKRRYRKFAPCKCDEYIYGDKKYIRVYCRGDHRLSNGREVHLGDHVWLEVSPIKWYVHPVKKIMISKIGLASGVRFCNRDKYKMAYFKNTDMYKFLNEHFIKDIVPSKVNKKQKSEMAKSNIDRLMLDIHEYLEGNPDRDKYLECLSAIADKYNKKIDELMRNKEKGIPSVESYESVTNAFELELNMFLIEVKKHHETYKEYFEMMSTLDRYIKLVNAKKYEEIDETLGDLALDLTTIRDICLPFIKEEDAKSIKNKIIDLLNSEKKEVANYIDGKGEIPYKTVDEMNIDLRKKIHPVLGGLSTFVNKRDVEVEIKTAVSKIIGGLFNKPKNEALSFYLVEINNIYTNINSLIDYLPSDMKKEYKKEILDIMNMNINYDREFNDVANDLKTMWLSLNKVLFRINGYLDEMNKMREGHIDVNKYR